MNIPNICKHNPVMFQTNHQPAKVIYTNFHIFSWLQILITQLFGTQIFTQLFLQHPPWRDSPKMDGMMDAMIIRIFDE